MFFVWEIANNVACLAALHCGRVRHENPSNVEVKCAEGDCNEGKYQSEYHELFFSTFSSSFSASRFVHFVCFFCSLRLLLTCHWPDMVSSASGDVWRVECSRVGG